jgi:hypothetical protein
MTRVVIDESLRNLLPNLGQPIEFCDPADQTIGHFVPDEVFRRMMLALANASTSDEELEQRRGEPRGRSLADIWKDLGQP